MAESVLIIFSIVFSYVFISYILFKVKVSRILFNKKYSLDKFISKYKNPYNLNPKYLFIIKYFISIIFLFLSLIQINNIFFSIISFLFIFFVPNILIYIKKKKSNILNIDNLKILVTNLNLSLICGSSLYEGLKSASNSLNNCEFKETIDKLIYNYMMNNFNIIKAIDSVSNKIEFLEGKMFLNILIDGEKEGELIESLNVFEETLRLSYFKILKLKESKRMGYIIFSSLIAVLNLIITVMYPILTQITENLNVILT